MENKRIDMILVDENDNQIWLEEKIITHQKWLLHRAISVIIINKKWEMLLQQRALNKYHCWWMWTNATCTHPYKNESNIEAAHRRLQEEMGFDTELEEIFEFKYLAEFNNWLIENEYDHVFIGHYDWEVKPNKEEVNDYKWLSIPDIQDDIFAEPGIYTQWFKIILWQYSSSIE